MRGTEPTYEDYLRFTPQHTKKPGVKTMPKNKPSKNEIVTLHVPSDIKAERKSAKKAEKKATKATKKEEKKQAKLIASAGVPSKQKTKLILKASELEADLAKINKERNKVDAKHTKEVSKLVTKAEKKSKKLADVQLQLSQIK